MEPLDQLHGHELLAAVVIRLDNHGLQRVRPLVLEGTLGCVRLDHVAPLVLERIVQAIRRPVSVLVHLQINLVDQVPILQVLCVLRVLGVNVVRHRHRVDRDDGLTVLPLVLEFDLLELLLPFRGVIHTERVA